MADIHKIAPLFAGWEETLIWSCLQGCMGYAVADDDLDPSAAEIVVGDFCFFAGAPNEALAARAAAPIMIPRDEGWAKAIESAWGSRAERSLRYAIKKEPDVFNPEKLAGYARSLKEGFSLKPVDEEIYGCLAREHWSKDLCSQFKDYGDYHKRGVGIVAVCRNKPVSGASSYTVYNGGIEIEIDTKPEFQQRGLAAACGARLILECLKQGLYPSWDAVDLRSVALAEKLGYHMDYPYTVYLKRGV